MNKEQKVKIGLAAVLCAITVAALGYMVQIAWAQPTNPAPQATITSVAGTAVQIVAANPSRHALQICNGAAGSVLVILPATGPTGAAVTPTAGIGITVANNTCYVPPTLLTFSGSSWGGGSAWNGISVGAANNVVALEW